jgi:hypothetical protein
LASGSGRFSILPASVRDIGSLGVEDEEMSKKKFDISLTLAEFYAIRNALAKQGNEIELLMKINEQIDMLHHYFDGRWHLPHGVEPNLRLWRLR